MANETVTSYGNRVCLKRQFVNAQFKPDLIQQHRYDQLRYDLALETSRDLLRDLFVVGKPTHSHLLTRAISMTVKDLSIHVVRSLMIEPLGHFD